MAKAVDDHVVLVTLKLEAQSSEPEALLATQEPAEQRFWRAVESMRSKPGGAEALKDLDFNVHCTFPSGVAAALIGRSCTTPTRKWKDLADVLETAAQLRKALANLEKVANPTGSRQRAPWPVLHLDEAWPSIREVYCKAWAGHGREDFSAERMDHLFEARKVQRNLEREAWERAQMAREETRQRRRDLRRVAADGRSKRRQLRQERHERRRMRQEEKEQRSWARLQARQERLEAARKAKGEHVQPKLEAILARWTVILKAQEAQERHRTAAKKAQDLRKARQAERAEKLLAQARARQEMKQRKERVHWLRKRDLTMEELLTGCRLLQDGHH